MAALGRVGRTYLPFLTGIRTRGPDWVQVEHQNQWSRIHYLGMTLCDHQLPLPRPFHSFLIRQWERSHEMDDNIMLDLELLAGLHQERIYPYLTAYVTTDQEMDFYSRYLRMRVLFGNAEAVVMAPRVLFS